MNRPTLARRIPAAGRFAIPVSLFLLAAPALASEDGLTLEPDMRVFPLLVFFVLLIFPVNALIFRPLLRVLDERDERITGTRDRAAKLQHDTEAILERYESSVRATRQESERERRAALDGVREEVQATTGAARADAERQIEQARNEVSSAYESARTTLRNDAQTLAGEAASQVLGRSL